MKKILYLLSVFLLTVCVNAQTTSKPQRIIIIDGYFFNKMPISQGNTSNVYMIETAKGTTAIGIELSEPLTEEALKHSIPIEQIPEGELLLERYNEIIENQKGLSIKSGQETILKEGEKFPDFSATDIDGKTWTNADVKGKVMVLNLWFTGCAPCPAEMPELSTWKDEMPDVMFFSSTYENAERTRPVLESKKFNWIPIVNDTQFKEFVGAKGYPMTIVIDKEGVITKVEYGTSSTQRAELKEIILSLR